MHTLNRPLHTLLLLTVLLMAVGCQANSAALPAATAVPQIPAAPTTAAIIPAITVPATTVPAAAIPEPTPLPTLTATPLPSPTPLPVLTLLVPAQWQEAASASIARLNQNGVEWHWQLAVGDSPETSSGAAVSQLALVQSEGALIVLDEPLALAVPFTTDWESVSGTDAAEILSAGHALVTVMPWRRMPPTLKALRVDGLLPHEAGYPLVEPWSLGFQPGYELAAETAAAELQAAMAPPALVSLTAVGDIMLARTLGNMIRQGEYDYPFAGVAGLLSGADLTIGNLETSLGDTGEPWPKRYPFQSPPEAAVSLAQAGFDILTLANNHAMDYGPDALLQGIALLAEQEIGVIGAGADAFQARSPLIIERQGLQIAFLGYVNVPVEVSGFDTAVWAAAADTPGLAWGSPELITADVKAAAENADLVVVVLHSGLEYIEAPSDPQIAAAHAAVEAGAGLVIGHHAHILQGIEFYQDGIIVYGLGNFAFDIEGDPETAILNVWLDGQGVRQLELVPAIIEFSGRPRPAQAWEARPILQNVYRLTNILNAN